MIVSGGGTLPPQALSRGQPNGYCPAAIRSAAVCPASYFGTVMTTDSGTERASPFHHPLNASEQHRRKIDWRMAHGQIVRERAPITEWLKRRASQWSCSGGLTTLRRKEFLSLP